MAKSLQDCVDDISLALKAAEDDLQIIIDEHMNDCPQDQRVRMRNARRKMLVLHCKLADMRDECFPDVVVQSGGT